MRLSSLACARETPPLTPTPPHPPSHHAPFAHSAATRYSFGPDFRHFDLGFRLAQDIEKIEAESNAEAERKSEVELAALRQKQEQPKGVWTEPVTGMRLVEVPGGSFEIGDQFDEGNKDEKPGWFYGDVDIQPFWLGATEVTQAQWKAIMNNNPSVSRETTVRWSR